MNWLTLSTLSYSSEIWLCLSIDSNIVDSVSLCGSICVPPLHVCMCVLYHPSWAPHIWWWFPVKPAQMQLWNMLLSFSLMAPNWRQLPLSCSMTAGLILHVWILFLNVWKANPSSAKKLCSLTLPLSQPSKTALVFGFMAHAVDGVLARHHISERHSS